MKNLSLTVLCLFFFAFSFAQKKKKKDPYICDDSTSVYSTSSKRPFRYGFPFSKKQCDDYSVYYNGDFKIKNGETIADVGGASGWLDAMLGIYLDSVNFYVEDIDTNFANDVQLGKAVNYFTGMRKRAQTNQFHFVLGTAKKTNLPDSTFDKIILNNVFHEFWNVDEMLADLKTKLKPGGELIISEGFATKYHKYRHEGCGIAGWKVASVIDWLNMDGYVLIRATEPENSFRNTLVFVLSKDPENPENLFSFGSNKVSSYITKLDLLNKTSVAKDSLQTLAIAMEMKEHLPEINMVYRTLENYLSTLGHFYLKDEQAVVALNIFKAELLLYPQSEDVDDDLADAYSKNKQYSLALEYYRKSLSIDPEDSYALDGIKEVEKFMKGEK